MTNILTVDLEDWYQSIENISYKDWQRFESRIIKSSNYLLNILRNYKVKATFFILGYEAERHPELVKKIFDEGHEIATHGYSHRLIYNISPEEFRKELRVSIDILESIVKQKILGHRAPAWSITENSLWALDIISEEGLVYDSSISPWKSYLYGISDSPRFPYKIKQGLSDKSKALYEFPVTTIRIMNKNIPFVGGFFTRLFPYAIIKYFIRRINEAGERALIWLHPWDLDIGQPRLKLPLLLRRHYYNLKSTEVKLRKLLRDFEFTTIKDVFGRIS